MSLCSRAWRAIRESFGYRPRKFGVRFLGGKYEKFDFCSYKSAEEWAYKYVPNLCDGKPGTYVDWLIFHYEPVELAIQPERVVREARVTPDAGR